MNVLITGGAGFIGSNLAFHLLQLGYRVVILDNLTSGFRDNLRALPDAHFIEGDIRNTDIVETAMKGVDIVFHMAASVGNARSIAYPVMDSEINVLGTLRILETARKYGVRKVVYSSSASIFGELKTLPIREDHPINPDSPYGVSKLAGEKLCLSYAKLFDIEAIALRYFNVYGVHQRYDAYGNVIPIFARRIIMNQPITIFGDGEQTRDFINVVDVVQANLKAATVEGISGVFNLGSNSRVTINVLAKTMIEIYNSNTSIEYSPARPGDVRHSLADISAARDSLGFVPTVELLDGLHEYLDWTCKNP